VVGGSIRAIDDDLQPVEAEVLRERILGELHVAPASIVDAPRASD
jgi:hypothetical protein